MGSKEQEQWSCANCVKDKMQKERNCDGSDNSRPVAEVTDGDGVDIHYRCPRRLLPSGFGGYRDRGFYTEMFSMCKEFGWTPVEFMDQDPVLIACLRMIANARSAAESARLNRPKEEAPGRGNKNKSRGKPRRK